MKECEQPDPLKPVNDTPKKAEKDPAEEYGGNARKNLSAADNRKSTVYQDAAKAERKDECNMSTKQGLHRKK
jgi:hypothetical protein